MNNVKFTPEYYLKKYYVACGKIPTRSEVAAIVGKPLAGRILEGRTDVLPELAVPARGPPPDMWASPSDSLVGNARTKPAERKCIRALTHDSILAIGREIEEKVKHAYEALTKKALHDQEMRHADETKYTERLLVKKTLLQQKKEFDGVVTDLHKDFNVFLATTVGKVQADMREQFKQQLKRRDRCMDQCWDRKLRLAVQYTVQEMTERFAIVLQKQSKELYDCFQKFLGEQFMKYAELFSKQRKNFKAKLVRIKKELQCENIANLMSTIIRERHNHCISMKAAQAKHSDELSSLRAYKALAEQHVELLVKEIKTKQSKIESQTVILADIIQEFQKFIYFVLQAMPEQAEFFLDVEILMLFALEKSQEKNFDTLYTCDSTTESESSLERDKIVVPDYHDCTNRVEVVSSVHTLSTNDDLPAFVYNENVYIREDFRNMTSQGLRLTESHEFWSPNVRDLQSNSDTNQKDDRPQKSALKNSTETSLPAGKREKKLSSISTSRDSLELARDRLHRNSDSKTVNSIGQKVKLLRDSIMVAKKQIRKRSAKSGLNKLLAEYFQDFSIEKDNNSMVSDLSMKERENLHKLLTALSDKDDDHVKHSSKSVLFTHEAVDKNVNITKSDVPDELAPVNRVKSLTDMFQKHPSLYQLFIT